MAIVVEINAVRRASSGQTVSREKHAAVQSLADIEWRLSRIPSLEAGIYAVGRIELADLHSEQEPAIRAALIEAEIFMRYQRELSGLSRQETLLLRLRRNALARLRQAESTS